MEWRDVIALWISHERITIVHIPVELEERKKFFTNIPLSELREIIIEKPNRFEIKELHRTGTLAKSEIALTLPEGTVCWRKPYNLLHCRVEEE